MNAGGEIRGGRTTTSWIVAILGLLLLFGASILNAVREAEGDSFGSLWGAFVATASLGLIVAAVIRFAFIKLARRGEFLSPWVLFIAGSVALFSLMGQVEEDREELAELAEEGRQCAETAPTPFVPLGDGLGYREVNPALLEQMASVLPPELQGTYEARRVIDRRGVLATVVTAEIGSEGDQRAGFNAGVVEGAEAQSGVETTTTATVNGQEVVIAEIPGQGTLLSGLGVCHGIMVGAPSRRVVLFVARRILPSARSPFPRELLRLRRD